MSRIIVKGLPKGIKEERLRSIFSEKGHITDCSMKYTKGGVFRKFAFIGYKNKEEAENAVQYFNNSFIDTTKIVVETAKDFGDEMKPRAWSKYSRDSSAYVKMKEKLEAKKSEKEKEDEQKLKKKKNKNFREEKLGELLGDLKDDPEFQEFLDVHKSRSQKQLWDNDLSVVKVDTKNKGDTAVKEVESDTDSDASDSERTHVEKEESVPKNQTTPTASEEEEGKERTAKSKISDLDYLKTKISKQNKMLDDEESSDSEDDARDEEDSSGDNSDSSEDDDNDKSQHDEDTKEIETTDIALHVVKMRGLPNNVKEKQLKQFFSPLEVKRVKIPKNAKGNSAFSVATVEFNSEKDTDEAMRRTKNFIEKGHITDCSMKYTKGGVFRKFAFIGYKNKEEAENAVQYFNNSFIDTTKIVVETAKDFGDEMKPRAWSKYSRDSSAYVKMKEKLEAKKSEKEKEDEQKLKKKKNKNFREEKLGELLGDLKDDPEFQEFLDVHKSRSQKQLWDNDLSVVKVDTKNKGDTAVKEVESDTDSDASDSERTHVEKEESVPKNQTTPTASEEEEGKERTAKSKISDLDYLKTKISKQNKMLDDEESSDSEDDARDEEDSSGDNSDSSEDDDNDKSQHDEDTKEIETTDIALHVVKMRGLPNNVKEKQLKQFFSPLEVKRVKIPKNAKGNSAFSVATVEFNSEKDTDEAMRRTKNFIGPKRILLYKIKKEKQSESRGAENARPWEEKMNEDNDGEEETIAESGRIFVRNLAYCCTEDDLEALFSKYGLLTEVHLPIDSLTKKVKGFAFITFMIPEHAVKAFTELDGTVFQGRMLHLLPGKEKKEDEEESKEGSSYKKQKEAERKKSASSSHNWNTLFLGANAVADVMAEKYGKRKSQILDTAAKESLGVRMALGETQIVAETREFLMENGIALDSFSQATGPRSKTVMLAKNLPSGTSAEELHDLFSKNGSVANIILPPSGVTAVIEFLEPSEARNAFRKLAYTKFKHLPLYLEWAPQNVFSEDRKVPNVSHKDKSAGAKEETMETESKEEQKEDQDQEQGDESDGEEQAEPGSVLFVKNLNFDSTEESLTKLFSKCGKLRNVTVSRKKDMKNPGKFLSMGYGFVEYKKRKSAAKAMKTLQHATLDGHQLELKVSNRDTLKRSEPSGHKKQDASKKQTGTKILVRNVPFEATTKEVRELFSVFGELKTARLPKKFSGTGTHRGFGFIDFLTKQDAKRAFNALCHSTHLYGRRLVLEWADSEESIDDLRRKTAQHYHEGPVAKRLKKSALKEDLEEGMDS